eukprot:6284278-Alexandrium_andersonii.AAC.1
MSASLVGSEMCIRDSHRPLPPHKVCPACCGCIFGMPAHGFCLGRGFGAVSYTHLTLPTICSV